MNHIFYILFLLLNVVPAFAQSGDEEAAVGYLRIFTDSDLIQVFLDGEAIGYSPLTERLVVNPGWHTVSFFPPDFKWSHWTHRQRKVIANVIEEGTHHVMVHPGELTEINVEWRELERKLIEYESSQWIGSLVGVTIVSVLLLLMMAAN